MQLLQTKCKQCNHKYSPCFSNLSTCILCLLSLSSQVNTLIFHYTRVTVHNKQQLLTSDLQKRKRKHKFAACLQRRQWVLPGSLWLVELVTWLPEVNIHISYRNIEIFLSRFKSVVICSLLLFVHCCFVKDKRSSLRFITLTDW